MLCPKCGAPVAENSRFCSECGTLVEAPQQVYNTQVNNLDYTIFGDNLPAVSIKLNPGESIYTQSGGLAWMDGGISMETNMKGGLMKGLGRMFSGDSLFIATYTSQAPNQEITFASSFPGTIIKIEPNGRSVIAQKSAFLCAQPSITLSAYVTKGFGAGLFGGEGLFLTTLTGPGKVWLQTMTMSEFTKRIIPYLPKTSSN